MQTNLGIRRSIMLVFRLALAILLSVAAFAPTIAQPGGPAAQTIDVANFSFSPKPIHLAAGKPVTLTFANHSGGGHDFTAPEFFAASSISAGGAPGGKIQLEGHETKSITLIPRAGIYQAHCSHFLDASMGMTDEIIV